MKKKLLIISSIMATLTMGAVAKTQDLNLMDIKQIGHSDGYSTQGLGIFKKQVFTGTNIYCANMNVSHNGKTATILVGYTVQDINKNESIHNPTNIVIGDLKNNTQGSSIKELKKLNTIGLSRAEFETQLNNQFKSVHFM